MSFFGSMPIAGPIAVAILSLGLQHRTRSAMFVAIGAACAEAIWAFLAFWGFATVLEHFPMLLPATRIAGSALLIGLGIYLAIRKNEPAPKVPEPTSHKRRHIVIGFSLTMLNPTLLVTWTAAIGAAHGARLLRVEPNDAWLFACGVGCGVVTWFATMLALLEKFHGRMKPRTTHLVTSLTGVAIAVLGIVFIVRTIVQLHS